MSNIIACNLCSYGQYRANAFARLQSIGVTCVEMGVPASEAVAPLMDEMDRYGLQATSLQGKCNLSDPGCVEALRPQVATARQMGVRILFLSIKAGETPRDEAYARLRALGDVAAAEGVTIAMETHPDLIHNGEIALQTMRAVDHPNVRVNFDTGNIYYYNEGTTAVAELRKIAPYVASVHLKDTNGGFHAFHFPALGEGVVDYPEVFRILKEHGFTGPFTLEMEGIQGENLDEEGRHQRVVASLNYLRGIGAMA